MNYKELIKFSSDLQLQSDELAYEFLELNKLFGLIAVQFVKVYVILIYRLFINVLLKY